jgi:membrane protein YqaA with SNARE-associated domain
MLRRRLCARRRDLVVVMVLLIVLSSLLVYAFHRRLMRLRRLGYLGLAIMSFLGGATVVLLPIPSLATTFAMGAVLNPWAVGFVASTAETLGTMSGFLLGTGVRRATRIYPESGPTQKHTFPLRLRSWMERHGLWAVFVFSTIPSPALDIVGVTAGALRLDLWKFLVVCWLGKTIKTLAVAWGGAGALPMIGDLVLQWTLAQGLWPR